MNINGHLPIVTLVLEVDIKPEGLMIIEELLEQIVDVVPPVYSYKSQDCTFTRKLVTINLCYNIMWQ